MATHSFKDLLVWQEGMSLAKAVYAICQQLPKEELFALGDQLRCSAISIPSNIAEGQKRLNRQEFIQFLGIALGSLAELETQLILVTNLYGVDTSNEQLQCTKVTGGVVKLVQALRTQNLELRTKKERTK